MPAPIIIWVWLCAYLNCAGWVLSALHQLNKTGYAAFFLLGLVLVWIWKKKSGATFAPGITLPKLRRRFTRIFPLAFLFLAVLGVAAGSLFTPANFDALAYRTPRVLHWLAAGQWHWVDTDFQRLNTRTAGFEWLMAPQFLFFHTDRLVFVLNVISFLLLPGRIFAVLTRLGVGRRAAWHWMWLFPSGYGYALQVGSVLNDMFGATLTLTAFEFALRLREKNSFGNFATSSIAAALMTAVKAFNLVLLLPWALAILPAIKILPRRPLATVTLAVFAASASLLPTAITNWRACGDWTGLKAEQATIGGGAEALRLYANIVAQCSANLVPPIFPFNHQWNAFMARVTPEKLWRDLHASMETGLAENRLPDMMTEESSGLGCGVTLLLLALLFWKLTHFRHCRWPGLNGLFRFEFIFFAAMWVGALVLMMKSGASGPARYFLAIYPLLVLPVLDAGTKLQSGLWRIGGLLIFAVAALVVIITPPRPLWPALTTLQKFNAEHSSNPLLQRAWTVYSVYRDRGNSFDPVLKKLPADVTRLGYIGFDEPEGALWRPFGARVIVHLRPADSAERIRQKQVQYALIRTDYLEKSGAGECDRWLRERHAETVEDFALKIRAGQPPEHWQLVRFL